MSGAEFKANVDSCNNETVGGWIVDPANPARVFDVDLYVNGSRQGGVRAGFPRSDVKEHGLGSGNNGFYIPLPPALSEEKASIEVRERLSQKLLAEPIVVKRTPSPSCAGLSRSEAAAMVSKPLLAVGRDAFAFSRNFITLCGVYLPPGGDPFAYDVEADEGIAFTLHRPLHDKGPLEYYWFWPNIEWGTWRIEINLAGTGHRGSAYRFVFRPHGDGAGDRSEVLYVPKDLGLWQNLPGGAAMNRVQLYDFAEASPLRAAMHCRAIADLARQHLGDLSGKTALDWGCGWGRLTRTFAAANTFGELWGADIDRDNLAWASANIPAARLVPVPLYPPTELPAETFDLVYALSVMTHLTRDAQEKWLAEVHRVLRPGGIAILTFHGPTALAFASAFLSERTVANFRRNGFDDGMECDQLDSVIGAGYYKNTFQTHQDVRQHWGRQLEVAHLCECGVGLQDVAVLLKR